MDSADDRAVARTRTPGHRTARNRAPGEEASRDRTRRGSDPAELPARSEFAELELGRQLCFALYSAGRAVTRAYGPLLEDLGLTYPQYLVMLVLWEQPGEPLSVGGLGRRLHLDSGTLTPLLKRLEALGHVHRRRDGADERRVLVELTPDGLALRDRAVGVPRAIAHRTGMSADGITRLRDELTRLVEALGAS